ncbi:shikimate kinase [bacterium]|nr:shikimate kinase [bacterium]
MCVGKTRVGKLLAMRLNWKFVDTDECIVKAAGMTIPEIFANRGEPAFRALEKECVFGVSAQKHQVISLGGGAVIDPENWDRIHATGLTVTLSYPPEIILRRAARKTNRPLLSQGSEQEKMAYIKNLLDKRQKYYRRADLILHLNQEIKPDFVADMIAGYLGVWQ